MQTETLQMVLDNAYMYARQLRAPAFKAEHVLYQLSVVDSDAKKMLEEFGLTKDNLGLIRTGRGGPLTDSKEVQELVARATFFSQSFGQKDVTCTHALLAILSMQDSYAYDKIRFLLRQNPSGNVPTSTENLSQLGKDRQLHTQSRCNSRCTGGVRRRFTQGI